MENNYQEPSSPLMSFPQFKDYLKLGDTKAREIISRPDCTFVVRVGRRVLIHKELLDQQLVKTAKYQLTM